MVQYIWACFVVLKSNGPMINSQTCIKRSPLGQRKSDLLKEVQFIWNYLWQGKKNVTFLTLAVVRWPTASENLFGPVTFAKFFNRIYINILILKFSGQKIWKSNFEDWVQVTAYLGDHVSRFDCTLYKPNVCGIQRYIILTRIVRFIFINMLIWYIQILTVNFKFCWHLFI